MNISSLVSFAGSSHISCPYLRGSPKLGPGFFYFSFSIISLGDLISFKGSNYQLYVDDSLCPALVSLLRSNPPIPASYYTFQIRCPRHLKLNISKADDYLSPLCLPTHPFYEVLYYHHGHHHPLSLPGYKPSVIPSFHITNQLSNLVIYLSTASLKYILFFVLT